MHKTARALVSVLKVHPITGSKGDFRLQCVWQHQNCELKEALEEVNAHI